jgi:hypothetical protein
MILFIVIFLTPFIFSSRGQIWHLIPVHPFLILIFFCLIYFFLNLLTSKIYHLSSAIIIALSLLISGPQILKNWQQFVDIPSYVSSETILSSAASGYPYALSIDDRFLPVAAYYSQKHVDDLPTPDISSYFNNLNPLLLITHSWRLDQIPTLKNRYQLIKSDRDMVLVLISPTVAP